MLPFFTEVFGNPAAITHPHGRRAATAVEEARSVVADFLGVRTTEVFFTAGATESNNLAIYGLLRPGDHAITSSIEHKSVLAPLRHLSGRGVELTVVSVDAEGFVDPAAVAKAIRPNTALVSIMAANGEIGTIEPIGAIAALCRQRRIRFHTDATQAVGKIPLDLSEIPCDLLALSAHKFYGPKGIGALIARGGARPEALTRGGGQEKGLRSGTVNVPGVVGLAAALEIRREEMNEEAKRLERLRNWLWDRIVDVIPAAFVHGPRALRLPGNLNATFGGVEAESLLFAMKRYSLSSGSACSAGEKEPSHVLRAIGMDETRAMESVRFGLGRSTEQEDLELLVEDLKIAVGRLREISTG